MQSKTVMPRRSSEGRIVPLGKARQLTRASFSGKNIELNPDRVYDLGG